MTERKTLSQLRAEKVVVSASDLKPKPPLRPKRKARTIKAQYLQSWEHWSRIKDLMDQIFPAPCIHLLDQATAEQEGLHGGGSEIVLGVDNARSNPDAIKTIGVLMKTHQDLLKAKIAPTHVIAAILKAWIGYAHLFGLKYDGQGNQELIPRIRLITRRLTAGQQRIRTTDIVTRMAGFAYRMDMLRRNRQQRFYPSPDWLDIYGSNPKYTVAWTDAINDPNIQEPLTYMLSLKPFVATTDDNGQELQQPSIPPAERLKQLEESLQRRLSELSHSEDLRRGKGFWASLPQEEQHRRAIGIEALEELHRLRKEIDDPAKEVL